MRKWCGRFHERSVWTAVMSSFCHSLMRYWPDKKQVADEVSQAAPWWSQRGTLKGKRSCVSSSACLACNLLQGLLAVWEMSSSSLLGSLPSEIQCTVCIPDRCSARKSPAIEFWMSLGFLHVLLKIRFHKKRSIAANLLLSVGAWQEVRILTEKPENINTGKYTSKCIYKLIQRKMLVVVCWVFLMGMEKQSCQYYFMPSKWWLTGSVFFNTLFPLFDLYLTYWSQRPALFHKCIGHKCSDGGEVN